MGTDIHTVFQSKTSNGWEDIEHEYKEERHYFLFAWLADVRNGFGFAGIPTHQPITPISTPRGLPVDFKIIEDDLHPVASLDLLGRSKEWHEDGEPLAVYMGDHSYSWLTADEILRAPRPDGVIRTGIVTRKFFETWDGKTEPNSWSHAISGVNVLVTTPDQIRSDTTHVRIEWTQTDDVLKYFIDEVARLQSLHGEVRMVFGFDS